MLSRIELRPTSIEKEVFPAVAADGKLFAFTLPGYWMDVGQPKDYLLGLNLHLASLRASKPAELAGGGAGFVGNVLLHPGAKVGAGCKIGPDVSVGDGCVIGDGVRLSNCVIMRGVKVRRAELLRGALCALALAGVARGCRAGPASAAFSCALFCARGRGLGSASKPTASTTTPTHVNTNQHDLITQPNQHQHPTSNINLTNINVNMQIGDHAKVDGSIVGWDSQIGRWARLEGHCVLGKDVQVKVRSGMGMGMG